MKTAKRTLDAKDHMVKIEFLPMKPGGATAIGHQVLSRQCPDSVELSRIKKGNLR